MNQIDEHQKGRFDLSWHDVTELAERATAAALEGVEANPNTRPPYVKAQTVAGSVVKESIFWALHHFLKDKAGAVDAPDTF